MQGLELDAIRHIIRSERRRQLYSQTELGDKCNLHRNTVYSFEKGKSDLLCGEVIKLLSALGIILTLQKEVILMYRDLKREDVKAGLKVQAKPNTESAYIIGTEPTELANDFICGCPDMCVIAMHKGSGHRVDGVDLVVVDDSVVLTSEGLEAIKAEAKKIEKEIEEFRTFLKEKGISIISDSEDDPNHITWTLAADLDVFLRAFGIMKE